MPGHPGLDRPDRAPLVTKPALSRLDGLARLGASLVLAQSAVFPSRLEELLSAARVPAEWAARLSRNLDASTNPAGWSAQRPDLPQLLADTERQLGAIGRYLGDFAIG